MQDYDRLISTLIDLRDGNNCDETSEDDVFTTVQTIINLSLLSVKSAPRSSTNNCEVSLYFVETKVTDPL